jgi:hypothetical protein
MAFDPISAGIEFAGKVVDRIWPDATEQQKTDASQRIAELAHAEGLFKTEVEDRKSAREREAAIATSEAAPLLSKIITPILAIGIVVLTFVLFGIVLLDGDAINDTRKDLAIYILGALSGICGMVASYYFGSSSGSVQKTEFIENQLRK